VRKNGKEEFMLKATNVRIWILAMLISPRVYGDPATTPSISVPAESQEVKISFSELLFGGEVAVKPSVYNGMSEPTVSAETLIGGIAVNAAKSSHDRSRLLEWGATVRLKVGAGLPADTYPGTERIAALGFQVAGRMEYGILPLTRQCGTLYISAGIGTELKATVMSPPVDKGAHDSVSSSSPDGQADIYARVGLGLACISNKLVLIISPFVARRIDSIAESSGTELGERSTLLLATSAAAVLEVATMATGNAGNSDRTTRALLSVRKSIGARFFVGAEASVTRNDLDHTSDVVYHKKITPFAVSLVAAVAF
jgi:hypothetical protein